MASENTLDKLAQKHGGALFGILLAGLALAVYAPATRFDFLCLDDAYYFYGNPQVMAGLTADSVRWAFGLESPFYWQPLTWLSFMLDAQLFGPSAYASHSVNILLHAANSALVYAVFRRMTGHAWSSVLAGALFAVHPMHVESVVWIAERKDVLAMFFSLLTLWTYVGYAQAVSPRRYLGVAALFALALMSKPSVVTLPCLMLLLDFWPLGRTRWWTRTSGPQFARASAGRLVLEKLPLLALSAGSVAMTILFNGKAEHYIPFHSLGVRLANALISYPAYLSKFFWPTDIVILYPFPASVPAWEWAASLVFLLASCLAALWTARSRPHLFVGWLWFLGAVVPTLKLHSLGFWYSIAARFAYLPFIGLYAALACEAELLAARGPRHARVVAAASVLIVASLAVDARVQLARWSDSLTLLQHTVAVTGDNPTMRQNLGVALASKGRQGEALPHLQAAVRIDPLDPASQSNLGAVLLDLGRPQEALPHLEESVRLAPERPAAYSSLADVNFALGRYAEAAQALQTAHRLAPQSFATAFNLGLTLAKLGRHQAAALAFAGALRLQPGNTRVQQLLNAAKIQVALGGGAQ